MRGLYRRTPEPVRFEPKWHASRTRALYHIDYCIVTRGRLPLLSYIPAHLLIPRGIWYLEGSRTQGDMILEGFDPRGLLTLLRTTARRYCWSRLFSKRLANAARGPHWEERAGRIFGRSCLARTDQLLGRLVEAGAPIMLSKIRPTGRGRPVEAGAWRDALKILGGSGWGK